MAHGSRQAQLHGSCESTDEHSPVVKTAKKLFSAQSGSWGDSP